MKTEKAKILLVDDEKNVLKSLKRMLRLEPYEIQITTNPQEAIELTKTERFDVIIGDYRMPGMNGAEMFFQINKKAPDTIKIILSGYADIDIITDALNQEYINKYILKPWNEENLKLELEKSIEHSKLVNTNKELHQKIIIQNEELKKINENLEYLVQKRTRKLELQNKALRISQIILDNIPVPVIGVDPDLMVVLTNKIAHKEFPQKIPGDKLKTQKLINLIEETDKSRIRTQTSITEISDKYPNVIVIPMEGNEKGFLITFLPD